MLRYPVPNFHDVHHKILYRFYMDLHYRQHQLNQLQSNISSALLYSLFLTALQ